MPVSSYATSAPPAVYTRKVVDPVHDAPAKRAPHMLTVNVCPGLAVTPHTGKLLVSVLVWPAVKSWHKPAEVGFAVGACVGVAVGKLGLVVVGFKVGRADGLGEGGRA